MHVDPAQLPEPQPDYFEAEWWMQHAETRTNLDGRGTALAVPGISGERWILREYRRGGLPGKLVKRHYAWLGEERTRAVREFRLLQSMRAQNLPVPSPVGVAIWRRGLGCRSSLLMQAIPSVRTLADVIATGTFDEATHGQALDTVLRRFQEAGYWHADLNARNILLDDQSDWWLIDWDRGRENVAPEQCARNRDRLVRSLRKIAAADGWRGQAHEQLIARLKK